MARMRWIRRFAWGLAALLATGLAGLGGYAMLTLPITDGTIRLRGANETIHIERDAVGIPTVRAANLHDVYFGLGVAHAQDRLWQMETHRRIGAGRLAEVFGPSALPTDRFLRALGVRRTAQAQWAQLPPASRQALQAYADGVNAVMHEQMRARPPEFVLLGIQPEPWSPIDSISWAIMMAWDLSGNWSTELLRLRLALVMPVARINELLPPYPGEAPMPSGDYAALYRGLGLGDGKDKSTATAWARLPEIAPLSGVEGVGSNNWVVAGSHSQSGHPLLANDPHLQLSTPALWYFARLEAPGLKVAGATLPGVPGVVLGQNEHIAWGYTNTGPDVQDLYIEQVDAQDPGRYRTPEGWAPFETTTELIKVKGQAAVTMQARRTRHGPVISDAGIADDLVGAPDAKPAPRYVLAMRWTALDAGNDALAPALAVQQAGSVAAFFSAMKDWVVPMQNMAVADDAGHIGMIAPGRVPIRKADNDLHGLAPAPGWDARYDWDGWVPADATPRQTDPPQGWLASANQRVTPPAYPYFLTSEWALPYRYERIVQLLQARPRASMDDLAAMQGDQKSLAAAALIPWLKKARSSHPLAAAAQAELADFDGQMAPDRAAPLIFWAWQRQLAQGLFAKEAGDALWRRSLASRSFQDALEGVLARDDASWCDDRRTPVRETCAQQVDAAFTRALDELQARFGSQLANWRWGRAHIMRAEHRPFSHVPLLARLFELRTGLGGDTNSINVSRVGLVPDAVTGELYLDEHGPSMRALYDLADLSQSRVMHSSGQSGIVFSPLYRNFLGPWARVEYVPLWPQGEPAQTLTIVPEAGPARPG